MTQKSAIDDVLALARLTTNDGEYAKRLQELRAAEAAHDRAEAAAKKAVEDLERQRDDLSAARAAFDRECAQRDAALKDREADAKKLHAEAQAHRDEAARTKQVVVDWVTRVRNAAHPWG